MRAGQVIAGDAAVDHQELKNEEDGILLLAARQPVAADFRLIVAALRMSPDEILSVSKNLERVGDLATNICEGTIYFVQGRMIKHAFGPKHQEEAPQP